jgi:hypothetical protein
MIRVQKSWIYGGLVACTIGGGLMFAGFSDPRVQPMVNLSAIERASAATVDKTDLALASAVKSEPRDMPPIIEKASAPAPAAKADEPSAEPKQASEPKPSKQRSSRSANKTCEGDGCKQRRARAKPGRDSEDSRSIEQIARAGYREWTGGSLD